MKKRLIYCDVCSKKIGPITDQDWAEGVAHQFAPFRRPEPPEKSDDDIVLVIHAEKRNGWSGPDSTHVDICRSCAMSMIIETVEEILAGLDRMCEEDIAKERENAGDI